MNLNILSSETVSHLTQVLTSISNIAQYKHTHTHTQDKGKGKVVPVPN
jgi:hypothetical protein